MTFLVRASGNSCSPATSPSPEEWICSSYRLHALWPDAAEVAARQLLMGECGRQQRELDSPFVRIAGIEP